MRWLRRFGQGARFFLVQHTKTGKIYQNGHNIYQMAMYITYQMFVKYSEWQQNMPNLYIPRPSKQFFV
jgi:ATP:corrinoid adenosyltransferase